MDPSQWKGFLGTRLVQVSKVDAQPSFDIRILN